MQREKSKIRFSVKLKRMATYALFIGFGCVLISYGVICRNIFLEVKALLENAQQEFKGDAIESLTALLNSDKYGYRDKNEAIWALDQIGDPKALPILERFYTGQFCEEPCRLDQKICQREVKRAIRNCRGAFSITRWMYHGFRKQ